MNGLINLVNRHTNESDLLYISLWLTGDEFNSFGVVIRLPLAVVEYPRRQMAFVSYSIKERKILEVRERHPYHTGIFLHMKNKKITRISIFFK